MKIIKLAIRSIISYRKYLFVNVLGLAISLACVITIFRYVYGEFTVDRFNKKLDRMYVTTVEDSSEFGLVRFSGTGFNDKDRVFVALKEHPGVELCSRFRVFDTDEIDVDNRKYTAAILFADSNFLKITDYPVMTGTRRLADPKSALITKSFAQKLFGAENPLGKTFRHSSGEMLTITGIIGQTSTKNTLSFDVIVSIYLSDFWNWIPQTFVLLFPNVDYQAINKQQGDFFTDPNSSFQKRVQLFPYSKVYFDKTIFNYTFNQGNYNYVVVLMAVGVLILFAGIINYINISTVVVLRRGRELGIKKVFGAGGQYIFMQLLVENLLMTVMALIIALIIVHATQPFLVNILLLSQVANIRFDLFLSCFMALSLPLLTTLYPFFRHHYSMPVSSMRSFDKIRGGSLRHVLLTFQYMITIVLIIVSLFFVKQLRFMLHTDPGYRTKDIIKAQFFNQGYFPLIRDLELVNTEAMETNRNRISQTRNEIAQKMNACPLFSYWTYGKSPREFSNALTSFKLPDGEYKQLNLARSNERWLRLFDMSLQAGRLWDDETDVESDNSLIVTESALKLFGITDFNSASLQRERGLSPSNRETGSTSYRIVGVVKDFDYWRLSQKSEPVAFYYSKGVSDTDALLAAIVPGRTKDAIEFLRLLNEETVGGEFTYTFIEDEIQAMYREDKKIASIYSFFSVIAIFVSVLGLLSMSLFDIQQRRKEIAIRKINGATMTDIIRLLLKKYFWTLGISFVIAAPVALFAINRYLEDFAHQAPVSWWLFAVAIALTAGVSLLTLIHQTRKAANQNPANVVS